MAWTSSVLSSSSRDAKFEMIRSGVTDLGITTLPSARFQAITTWAGVAPWDSAIRVTTGSSSSPPPWPSGDQDSVRIPLDAWYSRSSGWVKYGCSSIWFSTGRTPVSASTSSRSSTRKFETPIERMYPCSCRCTSAFQVSTASPSIVRGQLVQPQIGQGGRERAQRGFVALGLVGDLRGHEHLVAGQARRLQRPAHAFLVAVGAGGVDVAVAGQESLGHDLGGDVVLHLPDAEAELGDGAAVVESQGGRAGHGVPPDRGGAATCCRGHAGAARLPLSPPGGEPAATSPGLGQPPTRQTTRPALRQARCQSSGSPGSSASMTSTRASRGASRRSATARVPVGSSVSPACCGSWIATSSASTSSASSLVPRIARYR